MEQSLDMDEFAGEGYHSDDSSEENIESEGAIFCTTVLDLLLLYLKGFYLQFEDVEHNCVLEPEKESEEWFGYKFVGDNIDKNVRPSFQQLEHQSLHHFHGYAARDKINPSSYSDVQPRMVKPDPRVLLPSGSDLSKLKDEPTILMSR